MWGGGVLIMSSHGCWLMIGLLGYRKPHHSVPLSPPSSSSFPACFTLAIHGDLSVTHFWKNSTKDMSTLKIEEGEARERDMEGGKEKAQEHETKKKWKTKQSDTWSYKSHLLMIHNSPKSLTQPELWLEHTLAASVSLVPEPLPWLTNVCLCEMALTASVCKWGIFRGSEKRVEVKLGPRYHTHQACSPSLTKLLLSHDSFLSSPLCHLCRETWAQCSTCCTTTTPTYREHRDWPSSSLLLLPFLFLFLCSPLTLISFLIVLDFFKWFCLLRKKLWFLMLLRIELKFV